MLFLTACQSTAGNADEAKNDIVWEEVDVSGADAADDVVVSTENETSTLDDYVGSAGTEASIDTEIAADNESAVASEDTDATLPEDGSYTSKEDVALYIHLYGHLPENFITKKDAEALGWSGGSLEPYAPGKCIGGSRFGNYEGLLPEKDGRTYTECDIDTLGADKRGAKRIVFSNDGLIYYTEDHYETFELLYGEED
jgi:guanyl-specific ribonuclease Sa